MAEHMTVTRALKEKGINTGGDYVPLADLLDKETLITGIEDTDTQYGKGMRISVLQEDREMVTLTSSQSLMDKLNSIRDMLPLYGTFVQRRSKKGRMYYDVE